LEKALNNKQDTVDSIKTGGTVQQQPSPVVIVSSQTSSTIDYRELHVGKLIGSGEFAGKFRQKSFYSILHPFSYFSLLI
jgi:hypothetical protein